MRTPRRRTLLALGCVTLLPHGHGQRPNIVFLFTDDRTAHALGAAGNPDTITPHLDQLAREGVRFTNHYNTTAIRMASRASVPHSSRAYGAWAQDFFQAAKAWENPST